ncbi:hypothetical protein [Alloalcanivorax xenomutans]
MTERTDRELTLRELQVRLPWTIRYSQDFRSSPCTHKDFAHALHHVSKAAGKLHALADDMDHDRALADDPELGERYGKYIADLVVCALRLANTFPARTLDLQALTVHRIESKNGVSITAAAAASAIPTTPTTNSSRSSITMKPTPAGGRA